MLQRVIGADTVHRQVTYGLRLACTQAREQAARELSWGCARLQSM